MTDINFLYLTGADVSATGLDMPLVLNTVEDTFRLHYQGKINAPPKVVLDMDERKRGRGNAMPAYIGGDYNIFGIKWISGFPRNPQRFGLPRGIGILILNDAESGAPLVIMDCTQISAMRTGAVTGVGARYLARPDSRVVAMIGAGVQSRTQLEALRAVLPELNEVRSYDLRPEASAAYAEEMRQRFGLDVRAVATAEEAVRGADVVVTVTMGDEPIVKDAWLKTGVFMSAVGSYREEEDAVVLRSDRVIVDDYECVVHRGTPIVALLVQQGLIKREDVTEIGAILCGDSPKRRTVEERIFFTPIGMGSEDIAVGTWVYRRAREMGLGTTLSLFGG